MIRVLVTVVLVLLSLSANSTLPLAGSSAAQTEQVRAELIAHAPQGAKPGSEVWLGLKLTHEPHWHTYWKNPGDSGQATELQWSLPSGLQAGPIAWPTPQVLRIGSLINYGYEQTVLLAVPVQVSPDFKPSVINPTVDIGLKANWLVCKTECIPQEASFSLKLPVNGSTAAHAGDFQEQSKQLPRPLPGAGSAQIEANFLNIAIADLPAALQGQTLDLFPEQGEITEPSAPWRQNWQGSVWQAQVPISAYRSASPSQLAMVVAGTLDGQRQGFGSTVAIEGTWPAIKPLGAPTGTGATSSSSDLRIAPGMATSMWLALVGALVGGMILNLMPCVFPVLAIKVMSFTRKPGAVHSHRVQGVAYSSGVVLSFMALGALMLALRSAGDQIGWGFQLQSPAVVAGLAIMFTLIGLNLAGVYEFGQLLPSSLASLEAKNPVVNAFLSGVLAVLIASPCTAPFMGASLGLALSLPAWDAMLIFSTLGLGMALPYLAASWFPRFARALPRPGAWMNVFRHAMAFPMFATVVWLLWVLGQQTGVDGAAALMTLLVVLSMLVWALHLHGRARLPLALMSLVLLLGLGASIGPYVVHNSPQTTSSAQNERWQAWSANKVSALLAQNKPVFVDFTAAWCVTCQVNKKTTLTDAKVLADFDARGVTLLRADWTRQDPDITEALRSLGRNGVPVYVLYAPGRPATLLTELLSPSEVREALAKL